MKLEKKINRTNRSKAKFGREVKIGQNRNADKNSHFVYVHQAIDFSIVRTNNDEIRRYVMIDYATRRRREKYKAINKMLEKG